MFQSRRAVSSFLLVHRRVGKEPAGIRQLTRLADFEPVGAEALRQFPELRPVQLLQPADRRQVVVDHFMRALASGRPPPAAALAGNAARARATSAATFHPGAAAASATAVIASTVALARPRTTIVSRAV